MTRGTSNNTVRMPRFFRQAGATGVAAALLAGMALPGVAAADGMAGAGRDRPDLRATIQAIVDSGFAGAQLRVHDQRGDWVGSAGVRELGRAAKPPTNGRFRIGSNTKAFVSTVVLQLVEGGKVGLDAPVAGYLPEFGLDGRITVRMLLQHTSGLFDYTGQLVNGKPVPGIPLGGQEFVDNRFHTYQPQELVRFSLSKQPLFAPGTDWSYGNVNYVLAGLLIKNVTGSPYGDEIRKRILEPLGMSETVVPGTQPGIPGPHAHGYYPYQGVDHQWKVVDITRQNPSWASSAGEMISTTQDLQKFFSALNTGKLLQAPLLAEMRKPHPRSGYGLGVYVQDAGPNCGTVFKGLGGFHGYGTLMASTADGSRTYELSLNYGDSTANLGPAYTNADQMLVDQVLCGGQAHEAQRTKLDAPNQHTLRLDTF